MLSVATDRETGPSARLSRGASSCAAPVALTFNNALAPYLPIPIGWFTEHQWLIGRVSREHSSASPSFPTHPLNHILRRPNTPPPFLLQYPHLAIHPTHGQPSTLRSPGDASDAVTRIWPCKRCGTRVKRAQQRSEWRVDVHGVLLALRQMLAVSRPAPGSPPSHDPKRRSIDRMATKRDPERPWSLAQSSGARHLS